MYYCEKENHFLSFKNYSKASNINGCKVLKICHFLKQFFYLLKFARPKIFWNRKFYCLIVMFIAFGCSLEGPPDRYLHRIQLFLLVIVVGQGQESWLLLHYIFLKKIQILVFQLFRRLYISLYKYTRYKVSPLRKPSKNLLF